MMETTQTQGAPGAMMPVEVEVVEVPKARATKMPVKCRGCRTKFYELPDDQRQGYCFNCRVPSGGPREAALACIGAVRAALQDANPADLGKKIRLLDAARRHAAGKEWVETALEADIWSLTAKRRAGEIVEATPSGSRASRVAPGPAAGAMAAPRTDVRREMGITESESRSWQALARVPEPLFNMYIDGIRARDPGVPATVEGVLRTMEAATKMASKMSAGDPENEYTIIHRHDEQLVKPLVSAIRHLKKAAVFERIENIQDPRTKRFAIGELQRLSRYLHDQLEKLKVGFGG